MKAVVVVDVACDLPEANQRDEGAMLDYFRSEPFLPLKVRKQREWLGVDLFLRCDGPNLSAVRQCRQDPLLRFRQGHLPLLCPRGGLAEIMRVFANASV